MARTALVPVVPAKTGTTPVFSAANADGHMFRNYGEEFLIVKNGGGTSINVTIPVQRTIAGATITTAAVAVPAGAERWIGKLDRSLYDRAEGQTDPGMTYVDFSAVTSVTVALVSP